MERDEAEWTPGQGDGRLSVRDELEAVANRVRTRVDDVAAAQVRRGPRARRIVDAAERCRNLSVDLLGERMAEVVAAEAAFDVRNRRAQRPADHAAEHRRHRVPVDEDERAAGTVAQRSPYSPAFAQPGARYSRQPARDVGAHAQVAPPCATPEPDIGLA